MYLPKSEPCSTTFTLSPDVPPPPSERRHSHRHVGTLRVGKLITSGRQELCLIRNISSAGLMALVYTSHSAGERVEIQLKGEQRLSGEIVWTKDSCIGVQFDREIKVDQALEILSSCDERRPRAPRLDVRSFALLRIEARQHRVSVCDISQGGMKIEEKDPLPLRAPVIATIDDLGSIEGAIRWRANGYAGISFNRPISFNDLARWVGIHAG